MTDTITQRGTDLAVTHAPFNFYAYGIATLGFLDEIWVQAFVFHQMHQDVDIDIYPPVDHTAGHARLT